MTWRYSEDDASRILYMQLRLSAEHDIIAVPIQPLRSDDREELKGTRRDKDPLDIGVPGETKSFPGAVTRVGPHVNVGTIGEVSFGTFAFIITENNIKSSTNMPVFGDGISGVLTLN